MNTSVTILVTLVVYQFVLLGIGFWAQRRTTDDDDFFLGGRRLGAWVAAISASASSSSAWTLLGVSGAAYLWGLPAIWLIPATVSGFLLNWLWVAPRLMAESRRTGAITVTDYLTGPRDRPLARVTAISASFIILFSFMFYVASQFQASGTTFASTFGLDMEWAILIGGAVVIIYILLGGFWAVSVTDTLQGLLMAASALVLPITALIAVGGFGALASGLEGDAGLWTRGGGVMAGVGFVVGLLGIGLGYPGQPHVVNRFMALKDQRSLTHGRRIAIGWALIVYVGMVILGLCGRVLVTGLEDSEQVFFAVTRDLMPPVIAGVIIAAVLSAIMSTADSQLLVAGSSASHDLRRTDQGSGGSSHLVRSRVVVFGLSLAAIALAIFASEKIFTRVLFAWHAVGSALGPLLLVRLTGWEIRLPYVLTAMWIGFLGTVVLHWFPNTPGDIAERYLPFVGALVVALLGRSRTPRAPAAD